MKSTDSISAHTSPNHTFVLRGPFIPMKTADFDFHLPDDLIAQNPIEPRDRSRLMVVHRDQGTWEHRVFSDLPELLSPGDLLVKNNTRVIPARLVGHRLLTGGRWEGLFLRECEDGCGWEVLAKTRGRPAIGEVVEVGQGLRLTLVEKREAGAWRVVSESTENVFDLLSRHGRVPLPPYIRKGLDSPEDHERYQTVYARSAGSVAAPTAGLHFTPELLQRLEGRGIGSVDVTLHVGIGTFRPIEVDDIDAHQIHAERAEVLKEVAQRLNAQRQSGGAIIGVGTTATRTLETAARSGTFEPFEGDTAIYIKPGHIFQGINGLITNFHLPRSSLLVLVSALAGYELMRAAYAEAIRERYRFYSYGDAMLIL